METTSESWMFGMINNSDWLNTSNQWDERHGNISGSNFVTDSYERSGNSSGKTPENEDGDDCRIYNFIISGVLLGTFCLLGYVGNILTIITLSQQKRTSTRILLQSLAVVDTCILISAFLVKCVANCCLYIASYGDACFTYWFSLYPYLVSYLWPIGTIAHFSTLWITVLVTGNRYIAVCRPLHAKTLTRNSYIYIELIVVITIGILYNIPRFFEYNIEEMIHPTEGVKIHIIALSELFKNKTYQIVYRNISFFLVMNIFPLIILTVFTVFLVRAVWRARKARQKMMQTLSIKSYSDSRKDNNNNEDSALTFTLIIVVVVFFVCQVPAAVTRVFFMVSSDQSIECGQFFAEFAHLSDFLVFLNSSVNFIIYCVCSSKFRRDVRKVFSVKGPCCCCCPASVKGDRYGDPSSISRSDVTCTPNITSLHSNNVKGFRLAATSLSSMTSFPSVLSLAGDKESVVPHPDPDGVSFVSQETVITHL